MRATIFAVFDCGFEATCAAIIKAKMRLDKIIELIHECQFSIHDLSRIDLDHTTDLPRYNMPFELGLFMGALHYGANGHQDKQCLIMEKEPFRYQKVISDIAGWDISPHNGDEKTAIKKVRDWLNDHTNATLFGGKAIGDRYDEFQELLPDYCSELRFDKDDLPFKDYVHLVSKHLDKIGLAHNP
jgi:hypothetical protein